MVIAPASTAVAEGLTFTVGKITWTTRGGGVMTTTLEEIQIQSGTVEASTPITPTPRTRPPLPCYRAKRVDNSDLLQALDRADHNLLEASNLVDSISRKPNQATNSCLHARMTGDVPNDNIDHHGTDCQAQDSLPRPQLPSWSEQCGRSVFVAHPIPIWEYGLVAEPE